MNAAGIETAVASYGLRPLPAGVAEKFERYLNLLLKWNARLNLTAIREPEAIVRRQFLECIFLAQQLPPRIETLLDFGSGGGFPGIPISLCVPEIRVTLAESQGKKAVFLKEAVRVLGLQAEVYNGRVEMLGQSFDAVTLRAVDKMQEACQTATEKIRTGGWLLLFATEDTKDERIALAETWDWQQIKIPQSNQGLLLFARKTD